MPIEMEGVRFRGQAERENWQGEDGAALASGNHDDVELDRPRLQMGTKPHQAHRRRRTLRQVK